MSQIPSDTSHNTTIDQPSGVAQNEDAESGQDSPPASPTRTQSPPTASQGSLPHTSPAQQDTPSSSPSDPPGPPDPDQLLTLPISPHSVHEPSRVHLVDQIRANWLLEQQQDPAWTLNWRCHQPEWHDDLIHLYILL
eukprot:gene22150-29214_t